MTVQTDDSQTHTDDIAVLAAEAFIYGFPLVFDLQEVERFTRTGMGALTIVIQRDEPSEPARRANWLPAPSGAFRPILRMYDPDDAVFDGSYELPSIVRVD